MTAPRAFTAEDADQRIPMLLVLIQAGVRLERDKARVPVHLYIDTRTHTAIASFMGVEKLDKLFGLYVHTDTRENAQPFTIESESRSHG
jgi:class 3 adenylate cyclase